MNYLPDQAVLDKLSNIRSAERRHAIAMEAMRSIAGTMAINRATAKDIAAVAYQIADAMIAEGKRQQ